MPALYLKLAGAAAILLLVAGAAGWLYRNGYAAGEATVRAREQKAVMEALKQADAQKQADAKTSADTVQGLQNELKSLRDHPPAPVVVRLRCNKPDSGTSSAAAAGPATSEPRPTASGGLQPVPDANPDLGPGLQRLALACDTLSAEHRALLEWARGVSSTAH